MKKKGLVLGAIGVVSLIGGACAFLLHRKSKIDKFDVGGDFPFEDDEEYGDFDEDREYQTLKGEYPLDDDCCDDDEESSSLEEDWADMKEEWNETRESRNEQDDVEFPEDDE